MCHQARWHHLRRRQYTRERHVSMINSSTSPVLSEVNIQLVTQTMTRLTPAMTTISMTQRISPGKHVLNLQGTEMIH